ncbi:hypothetical protein P7K49_008049 [Saguinus oedipus]|uniref:Uncharacterized protein n=1 Tax=Saguinus oedipus TaxID=9490 RepID=A0ABQ9VZ02_SAGOE|nr:hypothetical protein P7K49_008049 [Saguinus oedipus]
MLAYSRVRQSRGPGARSLSHLAFMVQAAWVPGPRAPCAPSTPAAASRSGQRASGQRKCRALPASLPAAPSAPAATTQRPGPPPGHSAPARPGGRRGSDSGELGCPWARGAPALERRQLGASPVLRHRPWPS